MASVPEQDPAVPPRRKVRLADPEVQARQRERFAEHPDEWQSAVPLEDALTDAKRPDSSDS